LATVNIGNLSFTHRGDYASGTAYVKNDVVYYATNGNAYIAKQATTGNAPTNGTYWSQFAAGSGGIWNAGLSLGSAGQILQVNSGASALEFTAPSVGGVKQVIQDVKTDYTVSNSAGFIPNLDVTITPSATSSKILIDTRLSLTGQHGDGMGSELQRSIGGGSYSAIGQANAAGSRQRSSFSGSAYTGDGSGTDTVNIPVNGIFLDSPNTTSAITYKVYYKIAGSNYAGINMSTASDGTIQGDSADAIVMVSSMTCYEITV